MSIINFHQNIQRNDKNQQFSIEKLQKSAQSLLNLLVNPIFRFFLDITPYSDDVPYQLLPSCKKLETFNELNLRKCPKTHIFNTQSPDYDFFSKFQSCHFPYFVDPQLHAKFQKKLMSGLKDI